MIPIIQILPRNKWRQSSFGLPSSDDSAYFWETTRNLAESSRVVASRAKTRKMRTCINSHVVDTSSLYVEQRHEEKTSVTAMQTSVQIYELPAQREFDTGPRSTGADVGLMRRTVPAEALLGPLCPPPFQRKKRKRREKGNIRPPGIFSNRECMNTANQYRE